MKLFIVLLACVAVVLAGKPTEEQMEMINKHSAQCIEQEGVSADQATALRSGKFEDPDPKIKCYANCMMEKIGFVVNGQIKPEAIIDKLGSIEGAGDIKDALEKCQIKGNDKCDVSYQYMQCLRNSHAK